MAKKSVEGKGEKGEVSFEDVLKIIKNHLVNNEVPYMTWVELEGELRKRGVKDTKRFFGRVCDPLTWGIDEDTGKREKKFERAQLAELKLIKTYLYFPLKMVELYKNSNEL